MDAFADGAVGGSFEKFRDSGKFKTAIPEEVPAIIFAKIQAGCVIPWHWHTPSEHLMIVSGVARVDMKDGKPLTLRAGGFAMLESRHVHQFTCQQLCQFYIYSDAPFDMHYVDKQGNEVYKKRLLVAPLQGADRRCPYT